MLADYLSHKLLLTLRVCAPLTTTMSSWAMCMQRCNSNFPLSGTLQVDGSLKVCGLVINLAHRMEPLCTQVGQCGYIIRLCTHPLCSSSHN